MLIHALLGLLKGVSKGSPFIVQGDQLDGLGGTMLFGRELLVSCQTQGGKCCLSV